MDDILKELLHAGIQWKWTRLMVDEAKTASDSNTPLPSDLLHSMVAANKRLFSAVHAAEKAHGPAT